MAEMLNGIAGGQKLKSRWKQIADSQAAAKLLIFINQNGISDMEQLANKVSHIHKKQHDLAAKIKADERRLGTLTAHLTQYENYKQHKDVFKKYNQLDPKKRDAFYKNHSEEITLYENAKSYLDKVMNGHTTVPVKAWEKERNALTAERFARVEEYYNLKDDVQNVERLRRSAENIMSSIAVERSNSRSEINHTANIR